MSMTQKRKDDADSRVRHAHIMVLELLDARSKWALCGCCKVGKKVVRPRTPRGWMIWAEHFKIHVYSDQNKLWKSFLPIKHPDQARDLWYYLHGDLLDHRDKKKAVSAKQFLKDAGVVIPTDDELLKAAQLRNQYAHLPTTDRRSRMSRKIS